MKRLWLPVALAASITLANAAAYAQFRTFSDGGGERDKKTGRTEEGLAADAAIDKLYRSKAGQKTPNVNSDPWGDVRTSSTPAAQPAAKSKHKQP
jgi:hypothetical protein